MLRELKASRMGHWLEKKEDFFILSQEVKEVWHCCAPKKTKNMFLFKLIFLKTYK